MLLTQFWDVAALENASQENPDEPELGPGGEHDLRAREDERGERLAQRANVHVQDVLVDALVADDDKGEEVDERGQEMDQVGGEVGLAQQAQAQLHVQLGDAAFQRVQEEFGNAAHKFQANLK